MGFSPTQPQEATLARYRATLRLRSGSSRYRTNGKCWLSGHRSQRTPRYRSSRKGRSKRAQPEHGHALTSRSLALRAPSLTLGRARGCHRRVATLLIRSRRQACAGEHPLHQNRLLACKMGLEGIVSKRLGSRYRSGRSPDVLGNIPDLCCVSNKRAPSEIASDRRLGVSPGAIISPGDMTAAERAIAAASRKPAFSRAST